MANIPVVCGWRSVETGSEGLLFPVDACRVGGEMRDDMRRAPERRGATLVLVAVLIVVVGGMAAFAIDLARVYSGVSELQTGADAAALAAAERLQNVPTTDHTNATIAFAANNAAFGSALTLAGADVEPGFWNPDASTFTGATWATANSVRVTANRSTGLSFGRLLGIASLTPRRRAIAWIGNQATRDCIKPWGIDVSYINTLLPSPLNTQAGVNALGSLTPRNLTVVAGPPVNNPPGSPNVAPTQFSALTGPSSSRKEYLDALRDRSCNDGTADYAVGTNEARRQPGQGGGDVAAATVQGVEPVTSGNPNNRFDGICAAQSGNSAVCLDPATNAVGVTVTIAAVSPVAVTTANIEAFVGFRVMCVFRGGNQPGSGSPSESCPWLADNGFAPAANYVQGTIVGYLVPSTALTGGGNTLGNVVGGAQKLLLVQ